MKSLLGYTLMAFSVFAHANDPIFMDVNKSKPSFVVSLQANPTTGYQWSVVQYDKEILTLSSSTYQKPDTSLIGAGGHMLYKFTLNKGKAYPSKMELVFKYARPWEKKDTGSVQKVTVNFIESKG